MYSCNIHMALNFIYLDWTLVLLPGKCEIVLMIVTLFLGLFFLHTEIGVDAAGFWKFRIVLTQLIMSLLLFDISLNLLKDTSNWSYVISDVYLAKL